MDATPSLIHTFFNPDILAKTAPIVLASAGQTVLLGFLIIVCGIGLGILLASLRYYTRRRTVTALIVGYVDVLRALPPLVLLIVVYFALPYVNVSIDATLATFLCLSAILSAFIEECVWSGIAALAQGQMEAARSTGMTWSAAMRHVVLPQALKIALPQITNRCIATIKNTALGSVIGFNEVLGSAQAASSDFANPTPLTLSALVYIAMILPFVLFSRYLEHRTGSH
ncbi:MAG: polar amino acid ABC transporter permease [Candidatus Dactylopiibacterium carminicum]|uniref:Amino acid ABC transporter permease n=1 Tax=Candidatus Dactylopiibacterium carminicum TaxID=857335 RepID=A0A272ES36_9RHOO|nr:amino acid ABC transporter permease [Candidatus Dactylopiibacterium carminicum]KAF7598941.1 amino acid ABC transporter permease [Candidatus Dactylopiibacterium carminicum]PAS92917.1 MAG: polar amino acid ABC transporter permease [Candidatus Dactylopiibacterium carminicum]PAS98958.1 MAG: polar amino acid ABC transporter permease [Candidatus Dactylopiibacterium carminicum]